jgi:mannosyl-3-phosphoglycerate phosphatase
LSTKIVIYSDLDGTILDETYSFTDIQPIIQKLKALNTDIVLNSSKTRSEIEHYRTKLSVNDPFISENGSAIFIPKHYFKAPYKSAKESSQYNIIELGTPYSILRKKLEAIKRTSKAKIVGFGDMTTEEIAEDTNLPNNLAKLAQKREYDEPFRIVNGKESLVLEAIAAQGLLCTKGGKYYHLMGNTDKGKAVKVLTEIYLKEFNRTLTIGVGDGPNDQPMLAEVNKPYLIKDKQSLPVWKKILEIAQTNTPNV